MSGGYFEYRCFEISDFAERLKDEIERNNEETTDSFGNPDIRGYGAEALSRLVEAQKIIETAGKLAREVEWLYSGDHGEESFVRLADKILTGGQPNDA